MVDVDWSKPIEAVHRNGMIVAVQLDQSVPNPDVSGDYAIVDKLDCGIGYGPSVFTPDGKPWIGDKEDWAAWTIRNVTRPTHKTALECLDAMEALTRKIAAEGGFNPGDAIDEARRIVAEMAPVVDEDLVEARQLAALGVIEVEGTRTLKADIMAGKEDHIEVVQIALAAIKRGRTLATQGER